MICKLNVKVLHSVMKQLVIAFDARSVSFIHYHLPEGELSF